MKKFLVHVQGKCLQLNMRCCALCPSDTVNIAAFLINQ